MKTDPRSILYSPKYTLRRSTSSVYAKYLAWLTGLFKRRTLKAHRTSDHNRSNLLGLHSASFVGKPPITVKDNYRYLTGRVETLSPYQPMPFERMFIADK